MRSLLPLRLVGVFFPAAIAFAQIVPSEQSQAVTPACPPVSFQSADDAGLFRIQAQSECHKGEKIYATYDGVEYTGQFDKTGFAKFSIPLTDPQGKILLRYQRGYSGDVDSVNFQFDSKEIGRAHV
jgi:hypothetical protein